MPAPLHALSLLLLCTVFQALPAMEGPAVQFSGRASDEVADGTALKRDLARLVPAARAAALARLVGMPVADAAALRADEAGRLFYRCLRAPSTTPAAPAAAIPTAGPRAAPVAPVAPILHSRPGSPNVLFLDFDGGTVAGTVWNGTGTGVPHATAWNCLPFDRDGDPTTFSGAEQAAIADIWGQVAEDYAPFDIDVTTEPPAIFTARTAWALITPDVDADGQDCPHKDAGGIAYVDVFGDSAFAFRSPAWVWAGDASTPDTDVGDAAAHEAGHNLGLSHDGRAADPAPYGPAGYAVGFAADDAAPSWGPLMGAPYGRTLTLWSKGEYDGATNTQDDLAIIAGKLGYRPDDHGTGAGATPLAPVDGAFSVTGVIGAPGDSDAFSFSSDGGRLSIAVTPFNTTGSPPFIIGSDLDVRLTLLDGSGTLILSVDQAQFLAAGFAFDVPAGSYTLVVEPAAKGDPTATVSPSGYTTYGVAGQYTISGTVLRGPVIAIAPGNPVVLATIRVGESSDTPVTITNVGTVDATLQRIEAHPSASVSFVGMPSLPLTIAPGASTTWIIRFTPTSSHALSDWLDIYINDVVGRQFIRIEATVLPRLSATPGPTVDFGPVPVGSSVDRIIAIANRGSVAVTVISISPSGLDPAFTAVGGLPALPITLAPGASFSVTARYAPTTATISTSSIHLVHQVGIMLDTLVVELKGGGVGGGGGGGGRGGDDGGGGGGCGSGAGVGLILGLLTWKLVAARGRRKRP